MSNEVKKRFLSLDSMYFFSSIFLLLSMKSDFNYFDLLYFLLITFYYFKIKIHRKKN